MIQDNASSSDLVNLNLDPVNFITGMTARTARLFWALVAMGACCPEGVSVSLAELRLALHAVSRRRMRFESVERRLGVLRDTGVLSGDSGPSEGGLWCCKLSVTAVASLRALLSYLDSPLPLNVGRPKNVQDDSRSRLIISPCLYKHRLTNKFQVVRKKKQEILYGCGSVYASFGPSARLAAETVKSSRGTLASGVYRPGIILKTGKRTTLARPQKTSSEVSGFTKFPELTLCIAGEPSENTQEIDTKRFLESLTRSGKNTRIVGVCPEEESIQNSKVLDGTVQDGQINAEIAEEQGAEDQSKKLPQQALPGMEDLIPTTQDESEQAKLLGDWPGKKGEERTISVLTADLVKFWGNRSGRKKVRSTPKRLAMVRARLKDGCNWRELYQAIAGVCYSEFHRKGGYDTFEIALRSREKVESGRRLWLLHAPAKFVKKYISETGESLPGREEEFARIEREEKRRAEFEKRYFEMKEYREREQRLRDEQKREEEVPEELMQQLIADAERAVQLLKDNGDID